MNEYRENFLKERKDKSRELFEKIKNNPKPDALDLWNLTEDDFIEWRKLNDFPKLLKHFDKCLLLFQEWKQDNKLTDDLILATGELTPFLEHKKLSKKKKLYYIRYTYDGTTRFIVGYEERDEKNKDHDVTYEFETQFEFYSYSDWLKQRSKSQEILKITSRTGPKSKYESVRIHSNVYSSSNEFELLKLGGIEAPVNAFGILLRGKKMEFVNVCGLDLSGEIHFGEEGNLSFSYCACDNITANYLNMALLDFEHCSVKNLRLVNSKIQQWRFYDCDVSGDFENSQLRMINIWGGSFNPVMKSCTIFDVNIDKDKSLKDKNLYAYKLLKKTYADQGDDVNAIKYFLKEHEFLRQNSSGIRKKVKSISAIYWGYGRKPQRIIVNSIISIVLFTIIYWYNRDLVVLNNGTPTELSIWDCIYFSSTTFSTLGYGDYSPTGFLRIIAVIESFYGVLNAGFLVAGLSTNKY